MTPQIFIQKWRCAALTERAAAQSHFNDLCMLLDEATPTDADPAGAWFAFEKGARKTGGGQGWADVWKKGCFAWEYKARHKDLNAALRQLQQYALALDNPPLLIVFDLDAIEIHTNFTNTVHTVHRLTLDDLANGQRRQLLKWAFTAPDRLKPERTTAVVTAQAAETFAQLAQRLRKRGYDPRRIAHFITQLLFCMFAEDIGLLPSGLFTRLLEAALSQPDLFVGMAQSLFAAMRSGDAFGVEKIAWFNSGLFNEPDWFEKARALIESGKAQRTTGLVATNSIRGGANRKVLERILNTPLPSGERPGVKARIFNAWSDEHWVNEGAAVQVSLVCFGQYESVLISLNNQPVRDIYADLTGQALDSAIGIDLTQARPLKENAHIVFMGASKKAPFDIPGELARQWLLLPKNPNGRGNNDVLRPLWNAIDITRRPRDQWSIDFGTNISEENAALYEAPFQHALKYVKPKRSKNNRDAYRDYWWRFAEARPGMRTALTAMARYIATPAVSKHRIFVWLDSPILPDQALLVIAHNDDSIFGILHSHAHELWALRLGTSLEDRPRYTPTTCFETFPFPEGLTPNLPNSVYANDPYAKVIADAARLLVELRDHWLNPPEWVQRVPEVAPGYPNRLIPVDDHAAAELKKRTLTNLYNQRPAWLANAHRNLDAAVATAYGWPADLNDEQILRRLLALNRERANAQTT